MQHNTESNTYQKETYEQITTDGSTRQQKLYEYSIEILRLAEPPEGYYLCTSFGKDSIAAHRLCDEAGVKYDVHTNVTGIDPPELIYFGREFYPEPFVKREPYKMCMWQLIEKKGILPMRQKRYCCEVLKEDGGHGRTCVMGIRAAESDRRKKGWAPVAERAIKKRDRASQLRLFEPDDISQSLQRCITRGKLTVSPLYYWEDSDVWDFIHDRKMPYCSLYDEGFSRLGCIGCPQAGEAGRIQEFERWPRFRNLYIRTIERLMAQGRYSNFKTSEDVMKWWLSDKTQKKPIDDQISIDDEDFF